jgi:hypothetical protein
MSSVMRLATITSACCLNCARSFTTRERKNSGSFRAGSYTITSIPLALMRFMMP